MALVMVSIRTVNAAFRDEFIELEGLHKVIEAQVAFQRGVEARHYFESFLLVLAQQ